MISALRNARASTSIATIGLLVGLCVALTALPLVPASVASTRWSGYGASFAAWQNAHPSDVSDCPLHSCFGPHVKSAAQTFAFADVTTERGRVAGYDEGLANGTPLVRAELIALEQFPADTTMGSVYKHRDRYGRTCAFVNVQSKALARWFGKRRLGGYGNAGIELLTVTARGHFTYNPLAINLLLVVPTYLGSDDNC